MTRKDYVAIATAMNRNKPATDNDTDRAAHNMVRLQWASDCMAIADTLAEDNPRFDRDRFYRACEGDK
jgi:hypothetical protein